MTQIIIPTSCLKKAEKRADEDPLYSHKAFRNPTDVGRTIIEDYAKGVLVSQESIKIKNSELENRIKDLIQNELAKNGIKKRG